MGWLNEFEHPSLILGDQGIQTEEFEVWWSQSNDLKIDTRHLAGLSALLGNGKGWLA